MRKEFSTDAKDLLKRLLDPEPTKRLGWGSGDSKEIREHPFFSDIDWTEMYNRPKAPFIPVVQDEEDISQIDQLFTKELPQETPIESKLKDNDKERNYYGGFTYKRNNISTEMQTSGDFGANE